MVKARNKKDYWILDNDEQSKIIKECTQGPTVLMDFEKTEEKKIVEGLKEENCVEKMSYITNLLESIREDVTIFKDKRGIYSIKVPPEIKSEVNKILVSSYIDQPMLLLYADKCLNVKLLMDELANPEPEPEEETKAAAEGGSRRQATRGRKRTIKKKKTRKRGSRKNKK